MRFAVLSDIHGNLSGLRAVADDIAEHGPFDEIVAAGDHLFGAHVRRRFGLPSWISDGRWSEETMKKSWNMKKRLRTRFRPAIEMHLRLFTVGAWSKST